MSGLAKAKHRIACFLSSDTIIKTVAVSYIVLIEVVIKI